MKRKCIIVSYPGENGEKGFCDGVKLDVDNYYRYLTSNIGGAWEGVEIEHLPSPRKNELINSLNSIADDSYFLFVFCGHGYHNIDTDSTWIQLNKNEEIDIYDLKPKCFAKAMILDCCRRPYPSVVQESAYMEAIVKTASTTNRSDCRKYYDKKLSDCAGYRTVLYACSIGEVAGDDSEKGGYYSYSLLTAARKYLTSLNIDTLKKYKVLDIDVAHENSIAAVRRKSEDKQNPKIEKPRSTIQLPFGIVA